MEAKSSPPVTLRNRIAREQATCSFVVQPEGKNLPAPTAHVLLAVASG
jgi:hypothetical protein